MALTASGIKNVMGIGMPVIITSQEAIEKGDLVTNDGYKADANANRIAEYVAGMNCASGGNFAAYPEAIQDGTASTAAPYGGTAGALVYLSDTAGDYSETASTTIRQVVGVMLSATRSHLRPSKGQEIGVQGLTGTRLSVPNGGQFAEWFMTFASGTSATEGLTLQITDDGTTSSGYNRGLYINYTQAGTKTGTGEVNPLAVDVAVTGNVSAVYCVSLYTGSCGSATISNLWGIFLYMDDIGGSATVSNKYGLAIGIDNGDDATVCSFFRCYNHGGASNTIDYVLDFPNAGHGVSDYFIHVGATGGLVEVGDITSGKTCTHGIRCLIGASTVGVIPLYAD